MIVITNQRNGHKTQFKNYHRLFSYIDHKQRTGRHNLSRKSIDSWFLARHSYHRIRAFYEFFSVQKRKASQGATGNKMEKFDILEISDDISRKPVIIPITPDLNIERLIESWCQRWCRFRGYKLVEIEDDDGMLHVKRTQHHHSNGEDGS